MHIMEGFLPVEWAAFWYAVSVPVVLYGARELKKAFDADSEAKPLIAISGAFILVLSSLKLPSVTGSCSHPTGTGLGAVFLGPAITSVLSVIVLLYQALFLAHGGITTLGANVFSMGIVGPFAGYLAYTSTRRFGTVKAVFAATAVADLGTYVTTAGQLALAYPASQGGLIGTFAAFTSIFALTQVPLALVEGLLLAAVFRYVSELRPEMLPGPLGRKVAGGRGP